MDFKVIRNDITNMNVDAVVLPANSRLACGSGTSKAIFERAGMEDLKAACKALRKRFGKIWLGSAVPTLGFDLPAKYILHAVVPVWHGGDQNEYENLYSAYYSALDLADMMDCRSIAFPLLASGNNGFSLDCAIEIAVDAIKSFKPQYSLSEAYLLTYGDRATKRIKAKGFDVDEQIDSTYVLAKDERLKMPHEHIAEKAQKLANLYVVGGLEKAMDYLEDQETVDKVHKKAAKQFTKLLERLPDIIVAQLIAKRK